MVIRINLPRNKMRLWEVFSPKQKKALGGSYENAEIKYQTWAMWMKIYHDPEPVCFIEIGYKLGLIDLSMASIYSNSLTFTSAKIRSLTCPEGPHIWMHNRVQCPAVHENANARMDLL